MDDTEELQMRVTAKLQSYRAAIEYLDGCGDLTADKLVKMADICEGL